MRAGAAVMRFQAVHLSKSFRMDSRVDMGLPQFVPIAQGMPDAGSAGCSVHLTQVYLDSWGINISRLNTGNWYLQIRKSGQKLGVELSAEQLRAIVGQLGVCLDAPESGEAT
jgi:hypothetical protein